MRTIGVFYGGRSVEHDVSIITALQAMANIDREKYEILPLYLYENAFYTGSDFDELYVYRNFDKSAHTRVIIDGTSVFYVKKDKLKKIADIYCALVTAHGGEGEDGTLQGFLALNGIAYTSSPVAGSACGMDKGLMKRIFNTMNIPIVEYLETSKSEILHARSRVFDWVKERGYPVIVKPAEGGSSIGINVAECYEELSIALEVAAGFGEKIIVERALTDFKEYNMAAVRKGQEIILSAPERPVTYDRFLTFEDKYIGKKREGRASTRELPAKVDSELSDKLKQYTKEIYKAFGGKGVMRVDYLYDNRSKTLYANEINTVPGSLSFYLFEPEGINYAELLEILIHEGIERKHEEARYISRFESPVLDMSPGFKHMPPVRIQTE